jgi:hypothetical protein
MGLDASGLKDGIEAVLDSELDSMEDFAADLTDAIITYLNDVVIDYPPAPGVSPAAPYTDPSFSSGDSTPIITPDTQASALESAILASCNASEASETERQWAAAGAAYSAVILAIGSLWQTNDGYMSTGATVPGGTVDFAAAWEVGLSSEAGEEGGSKSDIAQDLADRIDDVTTGSTFTGAYLKGAFIGPSAHVSALS